ncbi:MAG TPA: glycosyltransferase family 2 protein [Pyrinomonadaceae bacterium]|nr:glycosyltransferase family 2 protein [Pyrinomonadaceae bacterium]
MDAPSKSLGSISIFFPAFNDEQTIGVLVRNALAIAPAFADDYEVLVINDGSSDGTAALLDELRRQDPHVKPIHHKVNRGYGGALQSGFEHATKEFVFYTDGDGQYDVRELARLVPLMTDGVDVVNGYKAKRADSLYRVIIGKIYNRTARLLFRLPIRDVDCDFRLIRRSALQGLGEISNSGAACLEMIRKLKATQAVFAEVEVSHYPRTHGHSQFFTFQSLARTFYDFCGLLVQAWISAFATATPASSQKKEEPGKEPIASEIVTVK